MQRLRDYVPALKYGAKIYPDEIAGIGAPLSSGRVIFVDGDKSSGGSGTTWEDAYTTIQAAVTAATSGDLIMIAEKTCLAANGLGGTATDPVSYTENIVIPDGKSQLSLVGVSRGRTQGGLPQIKVGSTTTSALLTIRSAGCLIANLGFNGAGATGGGILIDDDGGATKTAFGTTIAGCHFKNCKGTTATNAATGGAIQWSANGGGWQAQIIGNRFYKNVGDIVLKGTGVDVVQDLIIEDNHFSGPAASVDCNIYLAGGSGVNGVHIVHNFFPDLPNVGSGTNARFMDLTGCIGLLADNYFGSLTAATGSPVTFAAAGTGAKVPTTVWMAGNWGETTTAGESGEIIRT
ncbi:MAG: hypothetical protein PHI63_06260 [Patescibacteria group bacterium]|nr:hypothetical protein [Patescibacteria group bacterium]